MIYYQNKKQNVFTQETSFVITFVINRARIFMRLKKYTILHKKWNFYSDFDRALAINLWLTRSFFICILLTTKCQSWNIYLSLKTVFLYSGKSGNSKDICGDDKFKEDGDPWNVEAQTAFLGPNLWDKTLPYDTDLKVAHVSILFIWLSKLYLNVPVCIRFYYFHFIFIYVILFWII